MAARHVSAADVSIAALGESGDLNAPPGSQAWAIAVRHELQGALDSHESDVAHLKQMLHLLREHHGYKQLYDRRGRAFPSYPAFCVEPEPWGLGEDPAHIEALLAHRTTAQERAQQALPLAHPGTPTANERAAKGDRSTFSRGSTSADYLTARIARDRPDILGRMQAGEFRSVKAAAREAGLLPPQVTLPVVPRRAARLIRKHFSAQEVDELIALLLADRDARGGP